MKCVHCTCGATFCIKYHQVWWLGKVRNITNIGLVMYVTTLPLRVLTFIKIQTLFLFHSLCLQLLWLKLVTEDKLLFCTVLKATQVSCLYSRQGEITGKCYDKIFKWRNTIMFSSDPLPKHNFFLKIRILKNKQYSRVLLVRQSIYHVSTYIWHVHYL